ncbi:MAG TPA: hypothetical protein VLH40_02415 [Atribacteraceae bacterium]|nr:hypothetical protein [Atribacteraceae bacterium]
MLSGETIGIPGSGQWDWTIAFETRETGYSVIYQDSTPGSFGDQLTDNQIVAGFCKLEAAVRRIIRLVAALFEFDFAKSGVRVGQEPVKRFRLSGTSRIRMLTQNQCVTPPEEAMNERFSVKASRLRPFIIRMMFVTFHKLNSWYGFSATSLRGSSDLLTPVVTVILQANIWPKHCGRCLAAARRQITPIIREARRYFTSRANL